MPFNIGAPELIIILIIALIVLGPGKLPDVAQALGKSVREFRKAATDLNDAAKLEPGPTPPAAQTPPMAISTPPAATLAPNTLAEAPIPNRLADAPAPTPKNDTDGNAAAS
jgi:TatA/E family protein of Tat protein translocase